MNIEHLFSEKLVTIDLHSNTKEGAITELANLLYQQDRISDIDKFVKAVFSRENELSTTFEHGVALPHAKSDTVKQTSIAIGISRRGIYDSKKTDQQPITIFVLIASKKLSNNEHIQALSLVTAKLLDEEFRKSLLTAKSNKELYQLLTIEKKEPTNIDIKKTKDQRFFIGVTGCPVGIAHTYLAESSLKKTAKELGVAIKVETNGSIGVQNEPTPDEIALADAIIIASDKKVELERFQGKHVVFAGTKDAIDHADRLFKQAMDPDAPIYKANNKHQPKQRTEKVKGGSNLYKYLMNGVSYMIPFVVVGGLLIALSLAIGGKPTPAGLQIPKGSFWAEVNQVGVTGFTLMIPILAGFIAYAIGDRAALAPGMIGGWIANNGSFYHAQAGAGFIGAIIAGLLVGYFVLLIKKAPIPKILEPLMPIMIIPILATLFIASIFIFIIGAPISSLMNELYKVLTGLSGGSVVILGIVIGLMQGFDMGGPFGKVAFLFSVGLIAEGQTQFMGAQACAIPVAPLGMGLATFIAKKYFDKESIANGKSALAMGLVGISEGAIPFAASDPLIVIPSNMIGSVVACVLGFLFGITDAVAHGGPIVVLLGAVNKPLLALFAMLMGTIVTAGTYLILKRLFTSHKKQTVNDINTSSAIKQSGLEQVQ
ncbi:fructose-specific PTS transporter subunit EIIC [Sporolactobacillus sp. CQH2019]|uniref:PTS fructose transporter subunit IIABC n=1 Tax=Sporolactobacillus sp. CQH2019 TaxID=3023512 RepID=UPI00236851B3|nr:fructose-specific PTS transporter subunit EIIC [Sporolactobacillus sp. CQH2019]MDD9147986.1 fructose-specific PTS transporter subunit EIIC [Sporolactobacillus sp. CQH2019]